MFLKKFLHIESLETNVTIEHDVSVVDVSAFIAQQETHPSYKDRENYRKIVHFKSLN